MRLTRQTNYAIRLLMYCASNGDRLSRVQEISDANGVSSPFLFKILQPLVASGIVESVRGRNGGIRLARPSDQITLTEVLQVTETMVRAPHCAAEGIEECPLQDACSYHGVLNRAFDAFFLVLSRHTIADLVADRALLRARFGLGNGGPAGG